ncbi:MAG: dihydroorotase [Puniceicoccales bacterium]
MSEIFCISGGRIIDPANTRDETDDLYVRDGKIAASLTEDERKNATVFDAKGMIVCPGFVDLHVHLREPGDSHKETIASGTHAAAAGGYTSIVCMPNTKPPADNAGTIQFINERIERDAVVNVFPTGCLTAGREGKKLAPTGSLKEAGVVAVTDGGHCIQNNEIMRRALEYAAMFGLVVLDHCEDAAMTDKSVMHEGKWSLRLGMRGMPRAAEDIMVGRDVILSHHSGARIHIQQVSSAYSVDVIRRAKERGFPVCDEVNPQHLSLTDAALKDYNTHLKTVPPLRSEEDRQALIEALCDGTIDCIATAHAPHTEMEKDREFDYAPFGMNGLETALSVCLETLVKAGHCSLPQLISFLTHKAAKVIGLPKGTLSEGADADITVFDTETPWTVTAENLQSLSHNSPWLGQTLHGKVKATFVNGRNVLN